MGAFTYSALTIKGMTGRQIGSDMGGARVARHVHQAATMIAPNLNQGGRQ
jgi:hypothetical protein